MILLVPQWNPLLSQDGKAAAEAQIQSVFGGVFGGVDLLNTANLLAAAAVVLLMFLLSKILCALLSLVAKRGGRAHSMAGLFTSLTKLVCVIVALVWALGILGVNLAAIFASLGILSLIVGFGAQSLIEDAITGIFMIFEGQYQVGDIIVLDEFRGTVRNIGIRTTVIEDAGGNQKIVNNSDIRNLQNRSHNISVAVADIGICYEDRIEDVEAVLLPALQEIYERNQNIFEEAPTYAGVEALADSAVVLRITAKVREENYFIGYRTLNRELKILFDNNHINIPFPQLVVHKGE